MANEQNKQSLIVAWWNTSRNPPRQKRKHAVWSRVYSVVKKLCCDSDIVFLGEYLIEDRLRKLLDEINSRFRRYGIDKEMMIDGRVTEEICDDFRMACIFNRRMMVPGDVQDFRCYQDLFCEDAEGDDYYRVGIRFPFFMLSWGAAKIDFVASHWSQYSEMDSNEVKIEAACQLRRCLSADRYVIALGDYNLEPYGHALATLGATRSEQYAFDHEGLYNPFWRLLNDENGTLRATNKRMLKTYFPLFDQMMCNRTFVSEKFKCNPEICDKEYIKKLKRGEHYPIKLTLQKGE